MLLLLYGGIWLLMALFVTMGLASTTRPVSGGFVNWLKEQAVKLPVFAGFSLEQVLKLDRWIANKLGKHFQAIEDTGVKWLYGLAHYVYVVGYWSLYWPIGLHHAITHQNTVAVPKAIRARTKPLERRVEVAEAEAKAAAGAAHSTTVIVRKGGATKEITRIERVAMPHAGEWDWIHKHYKTLQKVVLGAAAGAAGVALPRAPALPVPWGKTAKQLRRRLTRVEALLGVTAFAVVLARVLGVSARCVKPSGPIGKVARRLCGLSATALEDLLGLIADVVIVTEICEVIPYLEQGLNVIAGPLADLIGEAGAALCGDDFAPPPDLAIPALSLPALVGATAVAV